MDRPDDLTPLLADFVEDGNLASALLHESYDLAMLTQELRKFYHLGIMRKVPKGTVLVRSGDTTNYLHYIEKGEVRIVRTLFDGREKILFCLHEGMIAGEVPFFDGLPAVSQVVAATDCQICAFERKVVFEQILPGNPKLLAAMLKTMASKIRMLCNQSVDISTSELSTRICRFILMRARTEHPEGCGKLNGTCLRPSLNQQELSSLLGVHRVTLNKTLRELENQGIIGPYSKKELYVLDEQRLVELANLQ